ncbi:hypothetical protein GCM10023172_16590 [Hymenobacter ginsengisoli]|uniref:TonB C-terminal domain-containing protein n=1 Tax=Hymenobacter ginsengisoli TaxID=1051626 RepID=A0ABP8QA47_9BACT|nr:MULTISPECIES: hypothetical protein [unclassified Hymenobacter]MBO2030796.1 hypothetical protein [Hymenobacter sp. BT559]
MKTKTWTLLGSLLLAAGVAHAQEGYSAPGFPMLPVHRPLPPEVVRGPLASPVLARFWHETDPIRQAAGRDQFFKFVSEQAHYPPAARPASDRPRDLMPTGRILVSVLVRANGSVRQPPRVVRRELARPEADYPPAALRALDAEALRVLGALRFVRSQALQDSLLVPMRFITE